MAKQGAGEATMDDLLMSGDTAGQHSVRRPASNRRIAKSQITDHRGSGDGTIDGGTLFHRYAAFVASFLYRNGIPKAELDDLVQEVFMNAHRRGGYRPGAASPQTFLARLALEARLGHIRGRARWQRLRTVTQIESQASPPPANPEQLTSAQQTVEQMQHILGSMQDGPRTVFVLFELEGESGHAIAAGLGIKLGTVYSRLHQARKIFSQQSETLP